MQTLSLETIRQALNSGEFGRAQVLWNECVGGLAEDVINRRLTEARLSDVRELVEWSRIVVLCERAHLQDQLNRLQTELHVAEGYELGVPQPACRLVEASF
jgi:predicted protein tyrosine phosphatase